MNETMGTLLELMLQRVNEIDQRITNMEESLEKLRSNSISKTGEKHYVYKDAYGWHLTDDFRDIKNALGVEEWKVV